MKKSFLFALLAIFAITSCSTVSSILQSTFPSTTNFIITSGSPANSQLASAQSLTGINQMTGSSSRVRDIRLNNATVNITQGDQGLGAFKYIRVYLSSGGNNEVLVASRENIADNHGSSINLDVQHSGALDNIFQAGSVQQRVVYELKQSPTTDLHMRTALSFNSSPMESSGQ